MAAARRSQRKNGSSRTLVLMATMRSSANDSQDQTISRAHLRQEHSTSASDHTRFSRIHGVPTGAPLLFRDGFQFCSDLVAPHCSLDVLKRRAVPKTFLKRGKVSIGCSQGAFGASAPTALSTLAASSSCRDRDHAAARLYDWTVFCIDSGVPEFGRLARTITTWRTEFLAYFTTGRISNGPTDAVNLLIKTILRVGHRFGNFHNYRLRLFLHWGIIWQHHTHHYEADHHARLRRASYPQEGD